MKLSECWTILAKVWKQRHNAEPRGLCPAACGPPLQAVKILQEEDQGMYYSNAQLRLHDRDKRASKFSKSELAPPQARQWLSLRTVSGHFLGLECRSEMALSMRQHVGLSPWAAETAVSLRWATFNVNLPESLWVCGG